MILLLSCFVTNHRLAGVNRYNRLDIFKYMLYSYRNIPFSNIYLFIKLDDEFKNYEEDLIHFIYKNYKKNELLNTIMELEIRLESIDSGTEVDDTYETNKHDEMLRTMRMTIVGGYS